MKKFYISLLIAILITGMAFTVVLADDNPPPDNPDNHPPGASTEIAPVIPDHPVDDPSNIPPGGSTQIAPVIPDHPTEVTTPYTAKERSDYKNRKVKFACPVFKILQIR